MKTKSMASVLLALLEVLIAVACGKSDPGVPSCDFVLANALSSDGTPDGVILEREALMEACRQSPWNDAARACVQAEIGGKGLQAVRPCFDKLDAPAKTSVTAALERVTKDRTLTKTAREITKANVIVRQDGRFAAIEITDDNARALGADGMLEKLGKELGMPVKLVDKALRSASPVAPPQFPTR